MDEITVGSDFIMKKKIWDSVNSTATTKITISHDMAEVQGNSE